jgi:[acyl-carrier-protein] S-malonyltransferase
MEPAKQELIEELRAVTVRDPTFPVIANATAEPIHDGVGARAGLGAQLTAPVQWVASMKRAVAQAGSDATFVEIGPGTVLGSLLRRVDRDARTAAVGTVDQANSLLEQHV